MFVVDFFRVWFLFCFGKKVYFHFVDDGFRRLPVSKLIKVCVREKIHFNYSHCLYAGALLCANFFFVFSYVDLYMNWPNWRLQQKLQHEYNTFIYGIAIYWIIMVDFRSFASLFLNIFFCTFSCIHYLHSFFHLLYVCFF